MLTTPNLALPYIAAAQAQKHVTHNEAIRALDGLVHLAVLDRHLVTPPATPSDGDRWIVAASPTGAWSGHAHHVAAFQDGAWYFFVPEVGWRAWIVDEAVLAVWDGAAWVAAASAGSGGGASVNPVALVGVNTTADTTNRLAVKSPASLFDHDGAGHQIKIDKATPAATASVVFQTNYSGRAEFGLAGDDDFHVKVSPDGLAWKEAIVVDRATGVVTLPFTPASGGAAQVPADWAATTGVARVLNKPPLGTAAALDTGTTAGRVVVLDGAAKLPAVDGSQLTNLPASGGSAGHSVVVDFGSIPATTKSFDVAIAAAVPGQKVLATPSLDVGSLGLGWDELEMDPLVVAAHVPSGGVVRLVVTALAGPIAGERRISLTVSS